MKCKREVWGGREGGHCLQIKAFLSSAECFRSDLQPWLAVAPGTPEAFVTRLLGTCPPALSFLLYETTIRCLRALTGSSVYINNHLLCRLKQCKKRRRNTKGKSNTVNSSTRGPLAPTAAPGYSSDWGRYSSRLVKQQCCVSVYATRFARIAKGRMNDRPLPESSRKTNDTICPGEGPQPTLSRPAHRGERTFSAEQSRADSE